MKKPLLDTRRLHTRWPSGDGKLVLVLNLTPYEITKRYGLLFRRSHDGLDWNQATYFNDDLIGPVELRHYEKSPVSGTECHADQDVATNIAIEIIRDLLSLDNHDIISANEDI